MFYIPIVFLRVWSQNKAPYASTHALVRLGDERVQRWLVPRHEKFKPEKEPRAVAFREIELVRHFVRLSKCHGAYATKHAR